MKRAFAWIVVCGLAVAGCGQMSAGSKEKLETLSADNAALAAKLTASFQAAKDGSLTVGEIEARIKEIEDARQKNMKEIAEITINENMTKIGAVAAGAGVLGRSALHLVGSGVIPLGPLAPIQPLLAGLIGLLLGGSSSKKKEPAPEVK